MGWYVPHRLRPLLRLGMLAALLLATSSVFAAETIQVSTEQQLRDAIDRINAEPPGEGTHFIVLRSDISITGGPLPTLRNNVVIQGNRHVLSSTAGGPMLTVGETLASTAPRILVTLNNLALTGGNVGDGGGASGGGALYVNARADVVVNNVTVSGNSVVNGVGGGIFVAEHGSIVIAGQSDISNNSATAGDGIFLQGSGTLNLRGPGAEQTLVMSDGISDAVGAGLSNNPWERWHLVLNGDSLEGRVMLGGNNQYSGDTHVTNTSLVVNHNDNLGGNNGSVILDRGGVVFGNGFELSRELNIGSGGGYLMVDGQGWAGINANIRGVANTFIEKRGEGTLELRRDTGFDGRWRVAEGFLAIEADSMLGNAGLTLAGGGLMLTAAVDQSSAIRRFEVSTEEDVFSRIHNGGHDIYLQEVGGIGNLAFLGKGDTYLQRAEHVGNTRVEEGRLFASLGATGATGGMEVMSGASWNLGNGASSVLSLTGQGRVELAGQTLQVGQPPPPEVEDAAATVFEGTFEGSGDIHIVSKALVGFSGDNQSSTADITLHSDSGLWIAHAHALTSGALNFNGGALHLQSGGTYTSDAKLLGNGTINIGEAGGSVVEWAGKIEGAHHLTIEGDGEVSLTNNGNDYRDTVLLNGAFLEYNTRTVTGSGRLVLEDGGGIRVTENLGTLGAIHLAGSGGAINTGQFNVATSSITGSGGLVCIPMVSPCTGLDKYGSGTLTLTLGGASYSGQTTVHEGNLRVVDVTSGALSGPIMLSSGTNVIFEQNQQGTFNGGILGPGSVIKRGAGTLTLGTNTTLGMACSLFGLCTNYSGNLRIEQGLVHYANTDVLGDGRVVLAGGGLSMGADLDQNVTVETEGILFVNSGTRHMNGDIEGKGNLAKQGSGTVIFNGHADLGSDHSLRVEAGKFQIGSGYSGTLLGDIEVWSGAEVGFGQDGMTLFNGTISGDGGLYKTGSSASGMPEEFSTLILTGDHTYTGPTRVTHGRLQIGGSLVSDIQLALGTGVIFDRSGSSTYIGALSGDGSLEIKNGLFTFSGDSSAFQGDTLLHSGGLLLEGQLGGELTTRGVALLGGSGQLHGKLNMLEGGQLAIGAQARNGSGFGTLSVDEAFFGPSTIWRLGLDHQGNTDRLDVSGVTLIDRARIEVQAAAGHYASAGTYRILEAANIQCTSDDCANKGFSVSTNQAFLTPLLRYGDTYLDLILRRSGAVATDFALTRNQKAVAAALDDLEANHPSHGVWQHVEVQAEEALPGLYDQLSGDALLASQAASQKAVSVFNRQLQLRTSRLGAASRGKQTTPEDLGAQLLDDHYRAQRLAAQWPVGQQAASSPVRKVEGFWVQGQQLQVDEKADAVVGNAAYELSGPMLAAGFDGYWGDHLMLGLGVGTFDGSLNFRDRSAEGDISSTFLGVYGRRDGRHLHLKTGFTLAQNSNSTKRQLATASGNRTVRSEVDSTLWSLQMELGYSSQWGAFGARPFVRLQHQHQQRDGFAEQGAAGTGALVVASAAQSGGEWGLGLEVSRPLLLTGPRWAQLQASIALLNPYGDDQARLKAHFQGAATPVFSVASAPVDGWITEYSLGGEYYVTKAAALWLGAQGRQAASGSELHGLLGFSVRW